eukprot:TRINITY_DN38275_c0_g1_i1.p1 TRINITY_DN38275_c0_g1~~TRINITY_DN38275_c0_g1_i1.p1  ORF type:complete len:725 (-),score=91.20 TRINITY_DN38275_c0_g1_i1:461-2569(-)
MEGESQAARSGRLGPYGTAASAASANSVGANPPTSAGFGTGFDGGGCNGQNGGNAGPAGRQPCAGACGGGLAALVADAERSETTAVASTPAGPGRVLRVEVNGLLHDWFDVAEMGDFVRSSAFASTLRENVARYFGVPVANQAIYDEDGLLTTNADFSRALQRISPMLYIYDLDEMGVELIDRTVEELDLIEQEMKTWKNLRMRSSKHGQAVSVAASGDKRRADGQDRLHGVGSYAEGGSGGTPAGAVPEQQELPLSKTHGSAANLGGGGLMKADGVSAGQINPFAGQGTALKGGTNHAMPASDAVAIHAGHSVSPQQPVDGDAAGNAAEASPTKYITAGGEGFSLLTPTPLVGTSVRGGAISTAPCIRVADPCGGVSAAGEVAVRRPQAEQYSSEATVPQCTSASVDHTPPHRHAHPPVMASIGGRTSLGSSGQPVLAHNARDNSRLSPIGGGVSTPPAPMARPAICGQVGTATPLTLGTAPHFGGSAPCANAGANTSFGGHAAFGTAGVQRSSSQILRPVTAQTADRSHSPTVRTNPTPRATTPTPLARPVTPVPVAVESMGGIQQGVTGMVPCGRPARSSTPRSGRATPVAPLVCFSGRTTTVSPQGQIPPVRTLHGSGSVTSGQLGQPQQQMHTPPAYAPQQAFHTSTTHQSFTSTVGADANASFNSSIAAGSGGFSSSNLRTHSPIVVRGDGGQLYC